MFTIINGVQVDLEDYIDNDNLIARLEKDETFISDVSYEFEKELSWADDEQSGDEILEMVVCKEIEKRTKLKTIWFRVGMEAQVSDEEMSILTNGSDYPKAHQLMKEIICRSVLNGETYILSKYDLDGYDNPEKEVDFNFDNEPLCEAKKFCIGQTYEWTDWFTGGTTYFVVKSIENNMITMSAVRHELDGVHTQDNLFTIETDENGNERILMTEYAGQKGYIYAD